MADKLVLDTSKIKNVAYQAGQANARITDAEAQLNQIRNHTNWKCREKYMLNSNAEALKSKIHRLQDKSEAFYHAMNNAANSLETAENEISGLFKEVEDIIGNVLSGTVVPAASVVGQLKDVVTKITSKIIQPAPWQQINDIWNHIQIVGMDSLTNNAEGNFSAGGGSGAFGSGGGGGGSR